MLVAAAALTATLAPAGCGSDDPQRPAASDRPAPSSTVGEDGGSTAEKSPGTYAY
jgi:hypothetical protein